MLNDGSLLYTLNSLLDFVIAGYPQFKNQDKILKKSRVNGQSNLNTENQTLSDIDDVVRGMPFDLLLDWETIFEQSLIDVKIHTGAKANRLAHGLDADAFAMGNDIYFADGKFAPDTEDGKMLLAHELAHIVQSNNKLPMRYHEDVEKLEYEANQFEQGVRGVETHSIRGFEWAGERESFQNTDVGSMNLEDFGERNKKDIIICVDREGKEYPMTEAEYRDGLEYIRKKLKDHYSELSTDEQRYRFLKKMKRF